MLPNAVAKDTPPRLTDPICPDVMVPASPFAAVPVIAIATFGVVTPGVIAVDRPSIPMDRPLAIDPAPVVVVAVSPVRNSKSISVIDPREPTAADPTSDGELPPEIAPEELVADTPTRSA
jgi:hypothetical protein